MLMFSNNYTATSYGCKPVFYWNSSGYNITLDDNVSIFTNAGINLTNKVINQNGSLIINPIPAALTKNLTIYSILVEINKLQSDVKAASLCSNYYLNVTLRGKTILNDYSYSQCSLLVIFSNMTPQVGDQLSIIGTAPGL
jgi:hypothetical protein